MRENKLDYIMVKPEGQAKIDKILKEIKESKLKFVGFYKVKDWFELSKKLYQEHYEKRGDDFAEDFESYANVTNDLYGNSALIILLSDDILSNDEFIKKVYDLKYDIRKKYGRYINGEYVIIANSAKMSIKRLKGKNIIKYRSFAELEDKEEYEVEYDYI